jgi:hypothetical protein
MLDIFECRIGVSVCMLDILVCRIRLFISEYIRNIKVSKKGYECK